MNSVPVKKTHETIKEYIDKVNDITSLETGNSIKSDRSLDIGCLKVLFSPVKTFLEVYIVRKKILDGVDGFTAASLAGIYSLVSHLKLWEYRMREKEEKGFVPPTTRIEIEALEQKYGS